MPALTRAQLIYPNSPTQFYGSTDEAMGAANQALAAQHNAIQSAPLVVVPPSIASVTPDVQPGIGPVSVDGQAPQPIVNPPRVLFSGGSANLQAPTPVRLPAVIPKPTFEQAMTSPDGTPAPINSSETKLGKLMHILLYAAQGGLAGRAASEQELAASGGRRNGGFATGFEAAQQQPLIQAQQRSDLENRELDNAQKRIMFPLQIGAAQARAQAEQARTNYWNTKAGQKDQKTLQQLYAQAVEAGDKDKITQYQQAIQAIQNKPQNSNPNELEIWRQQNPDAPIQNYWDQKAQAAHKYDKGFKPESTKATPGEFGHIEEQKNSALDKLRSQYHFNKDTGNFEKKDNTDKVVGQFTPQEWRDNLQQIQNDYEGEIQAAGGNVQHYEYPKSGAQQSAITTASQPTLQPKPAAEQIAPDKSQATRILKNKKGQSAYLIGNQWYVEGDNGLQPANK